MDIQWRCARSGGTPLRRGMVGWQTPRSDQIISYYNSSSTRIELQDAARGLDCCWAAGSWRGALCKKREWNVYPLRGEKPGLLPNLTYVRGDRGCRNPIPGDVAETRGFALYYIYVPKAKNVFRLATRDTLHGSRQNLRQREPDGRIVPTPPDVSDKGASTKRCAQRKK